MVCSSSVCCSVCVPVQKDETDLLQPVRGHADGMKYVFILNTIYSILCSKTLDIPYIT